MRGVSSYTRARARRVLRARAWHVCSRKERWAEAREKIARMTLTIKLDRNWNSFQLANSTPPLSVTDSAIAPSARIEMHVMSVGEFTQEY